MKKIHRRTFWVGVDRPFMYSFKQQIQEQVSEKGYRFVSGKLFELTAGDPWSTLWMQHGELLEMLEQ